VLVGVKIIIESLHIAQPPSDCHVQLDSNRNAPTALMRRKQHTHYDDATERTSGVDKSSTSLLAGVNALRVYLCRVAGNTVIPAGDR